MALWNQGDRDTNLILEEDKFKFNIVKNYVILYCLHCIVWAVKGGDERVLSYTVLTNLHLKNDTWKIPILLGLF